MTPKITPIKNQYSKSIKYLKIEVHKFLSIMDYHGEEGETEHITLNAEYRKNTSFLLKNFTFFTLDILGKTGPRLVIFRADN